MVRGKSVRKIKTNSEKYLNLCAKTEASHHTIFGKAICLFT